MKQQKVTAGRGFFLRTPAANGNMTEKNKRKISLYHRQFRTGNKTTDILIFFPKKKFHYNVFNVNSMSSEYFQEKQREQLKSKAKGERESRVCWTKLLSKVARKQGNIQNPQTETSEIVSHGGSKNTSDVNSWDREWLKERESSDPGLCL